MKRYPVLFIKWLANRFGYKIAMLKQQKEQQLLKVILNY
jgi:hypothetical protein